MRSRTRQILLGGFAIFTLSSGNAWASLTTFNSFNGAVGLSTDGCGTNTPSCTVTANALAGSTVLGAYLYSSTFSTFTNPNGTTFNGNVVSFAALAPNGGLRAWRADVTGIVGSVINPGPGGAYVFTVNEGAQTDSIDGEALVVVYNNPLLPAGSVGILDGFSASGGDSASINFAAPLHPGDPGFVAEMRIGDGFSFDGTGCTGSGQTSTISVNGVTITNSAGCNDDSRDATPQNGNLITMGGDNDPFSPFLPTTAQDHERYNLQPRITDGDTSITVRTNNPSNDDNIFLEAFLVTGNAGFNAPPPPTPGPTGVPEPATLALFGAGLAGLRALHRRKAKV